MGPCHARGRERGLLQSGKEDKYHINRYCVFFLLRGREVEINVLNEMK